MAATVAWAPRFQFAAVRKRVARPTEHWLLLVVSSILTVSRGWLVSEILKVAVPVGSATASVIGSIKTGLGGTLGGISIILALGAMIGRFLEHSGGGRVLAEWFLNRFSKRNAVWAVLIDWTWFGLTPSLQILLGGALIVGAGLWLVLHERHEDALASAHRPPS